MVPPAKRANSESWRPHKAPAIPSPTRAMTKTIRPRSAQGVVGISLFKQSDRHPADLKQDHRELEQRAEADVGPNHTGSFLGHCVEMIPPSWW